MPKLKDFLAVDLDTFFNLDEFAEMHDVHDWENMRRRIPCIIESVSQMERRRQPLDLYHATEGVFRSEIVLFCRKADLGYVPVVDQRLTIDGETYEVIEATEEFGLLEIRLGANRA